MAAVADSLHNTFISIDTHNDTSLEINYPGLPFSTYKGQVSFPLMKEGRLDVAFFAAFVNQGPCTEEGHKAAFEDADFQLKGLKAYLKEHADEAELAYTPDDMRRIKPTGRSTMVLAIENGYCIGTDLRKLSYFANMGVQMITLCHNKNNAICDSSRDTVQHGGLSPFGRKVVMEMNRLGIMIDVSHTSKATTLQTVELSKHPIMASHSGVYALKGNVRNISDEEIIAIAAKGGVVQVAIGAFFLSNGPPEEVTVKDIVDHIDHVVNLVGVEHVGIGSDFDGGGGVTDCNTMGEMKNITVELLRRGYTANQIAMIWGGNVMRMMDQVQGEAKRLAAEADSLHNTILSIDTHNDASMRINYPERSSLATRSMQVSFPLMKQGRLDVAFFAAYIGQGPRTQEGFQRAFESADFQLRGLKAYVQEHAEEAEIAYSPQEMWKIKKSGKSTMVLTIENGYCIGTDLSKIKHFSDLGVQAMTLCHNGYNEICDSHRDSVPQYGGLSPFGREVVKEMNRLGMIIDVAHATSESALEAATLSSDPIMTTHSGVYALLNSSRNITDEAIVAIAAKGGLIQVGIGGFFLSSLPRAEVTVKHLVDHIDHVVNLVGVDYVGVGSDFDGGGGVSDCNNMGEMKNITVELLRRGYTHEQIAKIWGGNVMRVMEQVQKKRLQP